MKHVISYHPYKAGLFHRRIKWRIGVSMGAHFIWFSAKTKEEGRERALRYLRESKTEHEEVEV